MGTPLGPKYIPYTYMDLLGNYIGPFARVNICKCSSLPQGRLFSVVLALQGLGCRAYGLVSRVGIGLRV